MIKISNKLVAAVLLVLKGATGIGLVIAGLYSSLAVHAQDSRPSNWELEEIVVTAQKKGVGESVQEVPIAITAFNGDKLERLQVQTLNDLSYSVPNVAIDSAGTQKGVANFTIRGLGVTSSEPGFDPAVGTFVDGIYMGVNYGVIIDTFDLESVEVLRGPQGLLFGRNVTGGAILLNTRKPGHEFAANIKANIETGLQKTVSGSVEGSLVKDVLAGKVAVKIKDDDGFFTNTANGNDDFGGEETTVLRSAFVYTPNENLDIAIKLETGNTEGDGPANQNLDFNDGQNVSLDNEGLSEIDWDSVVIQADYDVGFGDGRITNILGWRQVSNAVDTDFDSQAAAFGFDFFSILDQDQISNELRYTGSFLDGRWRTTAGIYYFTQDLIYREARELRGVPGIPFPPTGVRGTLGANQEHSTWGVFTSNEFDLSEALTLTLGVRYTDDDKDVQTARFTPLSPISTPPCAVTNPAALTTLRTLTSRALSLADCNFDFTDSQDWSNVSPKVGLEWQLRDDAKVFASWSKAFRSGGYTLRNSTTGAPGPTDEEEQSAIEFGFKADWLDGRLRTNGAVFHTSIDDLQRIITTPGGPGGFRQESLNTADATIQGIELEVTTFLTESLLFSAFFGYIDGEYDSVRNDLNGDGMVNGRDLQLAIPRLAEISYGATLDYTQSLSSGSELGVLLSYSYRDESEAIDANLPGTQVPERDMVAANINYTSADDKWTASLYGKNLLDEDLNVAINFFPPQFGGGRVAPLAKGRVIGVELGYRF